MKSLQQLCTPRDSVFDQQRRDTVLDLPDLPRGSIKPEEFFAENYITEEMCLMLKRRDVYYVKDGERIIKISHYDVWTNGLGGD